MKTLYDKLGRASLRLLHGCFVTYSEGTQLGWLNGEAVHDLEGKAIGRYTDGLLRDREGMIVAMELGAAPGRGGRLPGETENSDSWSETGCTSFFRPHHPEDAPDTAGLGRAS